MIYVLGGQLTQQSIDAFTVKKPVNLPVTKQGNPRTHVSYHSYL